MNALHKSFLFPFFLLVPCVFEYHMEEYAPQKGERFPPPMHKFRTPHHKQINTVLVTFL